MAAFYDIAKHEKCGYTFWLNRQGRSAGKIVWTFCPRCGTQFKVQAGMPKKETS